MTERGESPTVTRSHRLTLRSSPSSKVTFPVSETHWDQAREYTWLPRPVAQAWATAREAALTDLLQDELLVLRDGISAEIHDKDILPFLHSYAGLGLAGVIPYFVPGRILEKLTTV